MHAVFLVFLAAGAVFVWWSSGALPEVVASHFVSGGVANGFMPRGEFVGFMLAVVLLVPALLYSLGWLASRLPVQFVNLPNRQYWLAPERRAATLVRLERFGVWAAYATLGLLCVLHWLVVQANAQRPPHLEQSPFVGLMAVYFLALFVGMVAVLGRFFRVP
ncbi:MAG: hypothetical protein ABI330_20500 [Caldimonas sp.]